MDKKKIISIVVPAFNVNRYILRCAESIMSQSYPYIQIIFVDDGSTDGTGETLELLRKKDDRIQVVHIENKGASHARNVGLEMIEGDYFCFIDADDYIEKETCMDLLSTLEASMADIVFTSYYIDNESAAELQINSRPVPNKVMSNREALYYIYNRDTYKAVGGFVQTRMFKTDSFRSEEGWEVFFDEDVYYGEGTLFLAKCMMKAKRVVYLEHGYYHYVQNQESAMHNNHRMVDLLGPKKAYERIISLYEQNHVRTIDIMYVKRLLVYHMGRLAEKANQLHDHTKDSIFLLTIKGNLIAYIVLNIKYIQRIKWIFNIVCRLESCGKGE